MAVLTAIGEREDEERAVCGGSFSQDRSGWSRVLIYDQVANEQDIYDTIGNIVGYTYTNVSDGGLTRLLPKADPQFRYMVADSIASVQGLGQSQEIDKLPADVLESQLVYSNYGLWRTYDIRVNFSAAPYAVLSDAQITIHSATWYERGDSTARAFVYADEWLRFCLLDRAPKDDYATGTIPGRQRFYTGLAAGADSPEGKFDKHVIKQYLNNADVTLTWYGVPLRYVRSDNSYFEKYRGRVNQNAWETPWYTWAPGELLYQNYSYKEYVPPVAQIETDPIYGTITSIDKLCTVVLKFLETRRPSPDTFSVTDKNIIVGGHNMQPWWKDRKFHFYATPKAAGGDPVPSFDSADLRVLFTDPDFVQTPLAGGGKPI